jgi:hypothetical protein
VELTADEVRAAPEYKEGKPVVILDGLHNLPVSDQGLLKNPKRNARIRTKSRPKRNLIQEPHPCPSIDPRSPPLFSAS